MLEITSRSTRSEDQESKPQTYAQLGVREYVQYDPTGDYLKPPLQGLRLVAGTYEPLPVTERPEGRLVLYSAVLELELHLEDGQLHFYAAETGQKLLTHREAEQARLQAEQARLQAEHGRLQAEQARLQAEQGRVQAEQAASKPNRPACKPRSVPVGKLPCDGTQKRVLLNWKRNSVPSRHIAPQRTRSARGTP